MKITEAMREYAAEPGIAEEGSLINGMQVKSRTLIANGVNPYAKA